MKTRAREPHLSAPAAYRCPPPPPGTSVQTRSQGCTFTRHVGENDGHICPAAVSNDAMEFSLIDLCNDCGMTAADWVVQGTLAAVFLTIFWLRRWWACSPD